MSRGSLWKTTRDGEFVPQYISPWLSLYSLLFSCCSTGATRIFVNQPTSWHVLQSKPSKIPNLIMRRILATMEQHPRRRVCGECQMEWTSTISLSKSSPTLVLPFLVFMVALSLLPRNIGSLPTPFPIFVTISNEDVASPQGPFSSFPPRACSQGWRFCCQCGMHLRYGSANVGFGRLFLWRICGGHACHRIS